MAAAFQNVEVDFLGSSNKGKDILGAINLTQLIVQNSDFLIWPEDRYLIGWTPWMGFGKGAVLECHLMLFHNSTPLFLIGPHKESPSTIYDCAKAEFFPAGTGRLVKAGDPVLLQLLANPTGTYAGVQGNARIFSVKAQ